MALTNYTDLVASVASWIKRSDLAAQIPDFITMAEGRLSGDLDARPMEAAVSISVNAEYVATPTDMTEMRRFVLTSTSPRAKLRYVSPDQLTQQYPYAQTGQPAVFTVIGGNFQFAPIPDSTYTGELVYRQRIPSLQANNTNWLMTQFPECYLYAVLCEAIQFVIGAGDRQQVYEAKYKQYVDTINGIDWYSGSTPVMRSDVGRP